VIEFKKTILLDFHICFSEAQAKGTIKKRHCHDWRRKQLSRHNRKTAPFRIEKSFCCGRRNRDTFKQL